MPSLSREQLFELLERRLDDPAAAGNVDEEVWSRCGAERAIFVSDLSGFTRLTRKRGIVHFLSVYRRSTRLSMPVLAEHGGRCIKREADNLIYAFERVSDAVAAAREVIRRTHAMNASLEEDDRVHPCIGIGFGRIIELTDDVFGDEVNIAFKLGEDVATRGEVLLSEAAMNELQREDVEVPAVERGADLGGVKVRYFALI